jgi:hypothetical protein
MTIRLPGAGLCMQFQLEELLFETVIICHTAFTQAH